MSGSQVQLETDPGARYPVVCVSTLTTVWSSSFSQDSGTLLSYFSALSQIILPNISTGDLLSPLHLHGVCTVRARSTAPSAVTQRAVLSCMFQVKEEPGYKQLNSNTMQHTVLTYATLHELCTTDTGCIYFLFVVFYKGVRGQTELVCGSVQVLRLYFVSI